MTKMVFCKKLNQESPALEYPPYPGALGERIHQSISAEAWERWLRYQTILMNENNLSAIDSDHVEIIEGMMRDFLFNE